MKLPPKCHIEGMEKDFSFFFAGDAAFQRSQHMMASLKGKFWLLKRRSTITDSPEQEKAQKVALECFAKDMKCSLGH